MAGEWVGCETLTARLPRLRPRLHVFGHIHEDHGVRVCEWQPSTGEEGSNVDLERTVFVNAANYPSGPRRKGPDGTSYGIGQGSFQPVIVDLLDVVPQPVRPTQADV